MDAARFAREVRTEGESTMPDLLRRITAWNVKTNTQRIKETLDELRPDMQRRYADAAMKLASYETRAKQILCVAGIPTISYVPYLNFTRQMYKMVKSQMITSESAALGSEALIHRYVDLGLNRDVLEKIVRIFAMGEPEAQQPT
jgi:hypothetical protein